MSTIDFVVRDDAGAIQRGSLAGADGSSIVVAQGQDVSLNLQRGNILSYVRQGQALQVTLVDGQVLTLQGFFTPEGDQLADLFISANGALSVVDLTAGDGNLLYAQYVDGDGFGKWSPDDDLYFVRGSDVVVAGVEPADGAEAGMLGTALLGGIGGLGLPAGAAAAGLGSALLLTGGGGEDNGGEDGGVDNGGGDGDTTPPVVAITEGTESADHVVNADDHADGVEIGGTGTPGGTVTVVVEGNEEETTVGDDGTWEVTFPPEDVPGGEREVDVTVTIETDDGTATTTDTVIIDTVTTVTFENEIVETDGTINLVEESDGFTLTGTNEAGATVVVTIDGTDYDAVVDGTGWTLNVGSGVIAGGEYDLNVIVTATDGYSNTATTSGIVHVDTVTDVTVDTSAAGGNGTVNLVEYPDGFLVSGTAEVGATVVVTTNMGGEHTVVATDGTWSTTFTSSELPDGTYDLVVTAVSTDINMNTATASGTIAVDTELDVTVVTQNAGGNGTVNAQEHPDGVLLSGQTEANAEVTVTFGTGSYTINADGAGAWSQVFPASEVPTGQLHDEVATVRAVDAAGNVATATGVVVVDTVINVDLDTSGVADDGIVNFVERRDDGLTLSGTSDAFAEIDVTFNGVSRSTSADGDGNWTASWPTSAIPLGEHPAVAVSVRAEDAAGNVKTIQRSVEVDTFVNQLEFDAGADADIGTVNGAEAAQGLTIGGVVEQGSNPVMVSIARLGSSAVMATEQATVFDDGTWSVTFDADDIDQGTYDATVTVTATDRAGNTDSISDNFAVDTDPNAAPDIEDYTDSSSGVKGFSMLTPDGVVDVDEVQFDGSSATDQPIGQRSDFDGETSIRFTSENYVQDGSHLIVTDTDTAGNTNSTLFVLDDTATNDVSFPMANLDGYNIGAIDLELAEDTDLTISVADIKAMSDNDDNLIIHGGVDDSVTLEGTATDTGDTQVINSQTYKVVDLGDDSTLLINDQIQFSTI
ncbi:Ig-like domain-containing protein [Yoonia sp. 208BN28-4]|uniref:Ig-like domain-containing protein n=1 Tax=Yoonia sp. 208BN28-4 TaxID=3126505 RepID=UPI003095CDC8